MNIIEAGEWRCDKWGMSRSPTITCCLKKDVTTPDLGCVSALESNIHFNNTETNWQPKSIDISPGLKVKCLSESGRKICFFPKDLKTRNWKNSTLVLLKKRATQL